MTGRLVAVNVVHALVPDPTGGVGRTAIDKRPAEGPVAVGRLGLVGDTVMDRAHHGGVDKALYAYAAEDQAWWAVELARELPPGVFGENLTTDGLDVTGAVIGERWRLGSDVEVEVAMPRTPCVTFQAWLGEAHWVRRFTEHGAPGAYLRVRVEGRVGAGDPIEVVHRPTHGVTVGEVFRPRSADAERLRLLLAEPDLAADLRAALVRGLPG